MANVLFAFDHTMKELFEYPDPTVPFIVWNGTLSAMPNRAIDCHWHNEFEYAMLLSGELDYYIDGQGVRMRPGDVVFVNANALHMAKPTREGEDAHILTVSFLPDLLTGGSNGTMYKKYFQPILIASCRGFHIKNQENCRILSLLRQLHAINTSNTRHYELMCIAIVCSLWSETLNYIRSHPEIILALDAEKRYEQKTKDAISFIHEHFSEDIRISDITKGTFISRSELFRSFQHYMNQSPIEYLVAYRLAQAANKLMKTGMPISQIAAECGFSDASYFGKAFKKKFGVSPMRFRNVKIMATKKIHAELVTGYEDYTAENAEDANEAFEKFGNARVNP